MNEMTNWLNNKLIKWLIVDEMTNWLNNKLIKWQIVDEMKIVMKWQVVDEMTSCWWNDKLLMK
jgi:hypothetical protein